MNGLWLALFMAILVLCAEGGPRQRRNRGGKAVIRRGLVIIPGVGRPDRLRTLVGSLKVLERDYLTAPQSPGGLMGWDCIVYIYASHDEATEFWSMREELEFVKSLCRTVEHPNRRVTENLYLAQPALFRHAYSHVFILLDDCKLQRGFNLQHIMRSMEYNNLTIASPRVVGANVGGGQKFRKIMQALPQSETDGYTSTFVEWFAWVMTFQAYQALWELLCPHVNPFGWGYDFWYDNYAKSRVPGHKMGIVSTIEVKHEQDTTTPGAGRTDNTKVETKWAAVLSQEKHYRDHLGIDLKAIRQKLKLQNTTWNGAVTGFLSIPPLHTRPKTPV